jgi:polyisoprenoid-binding protein YceI
MSTDATPSRPAASDLATGAWGLDPAHSSIEFHVPHFWGLITVKGHFERYEGTLDLEAEPAVELTIEAESLQTGNRKRDQHLRSADFFDAEHHPQIRFVSETAALEDTTFKVRGRLHAAGRSIPLELDATVHSVEGGFEIEAVTHAPHHELGMTWSPLGIARPHSTLIVKGRLERR